MEEHLTTILDGLPDDPGVYLHKDDAGRVLYVGKAKSLRSRVRSYFQPSANHTVRISAMVRQVRDIQIVQTQSEAEALILEANLIKKHKPRYNINLKDDKSYPFFKLTVNEPYPRLYLTREKFERGAEYFGPYASVKAARETLNVIRRHFRLRTSKMKLDGTRTYRPCINHQLHKCLAPCQGNVPQADYTALVDEVRMFFQGRYKELMGRLEQEMAELATAQRYEEAARRRDAITAIQRTMEKQQVLSPDPSADQDVFAIHRESHYAGIEMLFIRNGRLIGTDFMLFERTEGMTDEEILGAWLNRLYTRPAALFPKEILLPLEVEDMALLERFLSGEKGQRVYLLAPQRGDKRKLVEFAANNARRNLKERIQFRVDDDAVLAEVQRTLRLRHTPRVVEAFDISNIQGTHPVASMVVFKENRAHKDAYRKYRINSTQGPDDFLAMMEVLGRRYKRSADGELPLPDLILIDGGKGQVNVARAVLNALGIGPREVDLIGLAKGRTERRTGFRPRGGQAVAGDDYEYVVRPEAKTEQRLKRNSATLHFLQRIRDESHRFAVDYHRTLRRNSTLRSGLEDIPGVGRKTAQGLLRHFGSLKRVREADVEALKEVPGMAQRTAEAVFRAFHD